MAPCCKAAQDMRPEANGQNACKARGRAGQRDRGEAAGTQEGDDEERDEEDERRAEVVSAIATVGLSLGLTPQLSAASRVILILLMYAGRIGGLSFVLLFSERRSEPPLDRPTGKILIG